MSDHKQHVAEDSWGGRQPKYRALVMRGPGHFEIVTQKPSGERVSARLGAVSFRIRPAP